VNEFPIQDERQKAINLPPATAVLAGVLILIHLGRQFLSIEADERLILNFALIPDRLTQTPLDWGAVGALFSHMLLHGGWLHLVANTGMLLAFAAGLEKLIGAPRMLLLALISGLAGALLHVAVYPHDGTPMLGASGAISGLFGAMMVLLAQRQRSPRFVLGVSALWLASNVALGLSGIPSGDETMEIAWVAHLGGYIAGLLGMLVLAPRRRAR
jgi:membrane associated rhomboid family serine protease